VAGDKGSFENNNFGMNNEEDQQDYGFGNYQQDSDEVDDCE
jgi:hypothetical protein